MANVGNNMFAALTSISTSTSVSPDGRDTGRTGNGFSQLGNGRATNVSINVPHELTLQGLNQRWQSISPTAKHADRVSRHVKRVTESGRSHVLTDHLDSLGDKISHLKHSLRANGSLLVQELPKPEMTPLSSPATPLVDFASVRETIRCDVEALDWTVVQGSPRFGRNRKVNLDGTLVQGKDYYQDHESKVKELLSKSLSAPANYVNNNNYEEENGEFVRCEGSLSEEVFDDTGKEHYHGFSHQDKHSRSAKDRRRVAYNKEKRKAQSNEEKAKNPPKPKKGAKPKKAEKQDGK